MPALLVVLAAPPADDVPLAAPVLGHAVLRGGRDR
jgi:hypothetical protein